MPAAPPRGEQRILLGQVASRERSFDSWTMAEWLPNPDPILKALGRDIATYRDLRADAHVGGCIRRRKSAVDSLETVLERDRATARVTRAVESVLAELWATPDPDEPGARPGLPALIAEALDGALYGYQPLEVTWGRVGSLLVPQVVQGKPPEWFHFDANNQLRFKSREAGAAGEPLPARKFLLARQEPTYQNPYGVPDLAMVFWPYTFRRAAKFWVSWLERYGGDFLLGKLPRSASPTEYDALTERLEGMIQDAVAAIPDDGSVEVIASASKGASTDAHERFLLYWRGEISIALLGTNQGTEQSSTLASATAALEVANDIRDHDARMVEAVVNQLIRWTVQLNWPDSPPPRWSLREQEEIDTDRPARDKILVECGVRFSRDYWLRTYDLEDSDLAEEAAPMDPARAMPGAPGTPPPPAEAAPAALAEPIDPDGQDLIDAELAREASAEQQAAMEQLLAPILDALGEGLTAEEIMGRMDEWYGALDDSLLQELLARGIAAADAIGRLEMSDESR